MKNFIAIITLAGAAAMFSGCAATVGYRDGYGYNDRYQSRPFYNPGYYTYNNDHPMHRPFDSYHFHPVVRPPVAPHAVVRHDNVHVDVHHDRAHGEANVR